MQLSLVVAQSAAESAQKHKLFKKAYQTLSSASHCAINNGHAS